ncbi:hypothetical protein QJQ45_023560, partial [Haematococcus lacustris]
VSHGLARVPSPTYSTTSSSDGTGSSSSSSRVCTPAQKPPALGPHSTALPAASQRSAQPSPQPQPSPANSTSCGADPGQGGGSSSQGGKQRRPQPLPLLPPAQQPPAAPQPGQQPRPRSNWQPAQAPDPTPGSGGRADHARLPYQQQGKGDWQAGGVDAAGTHPGTQGVGGGGRRGRGSSRAGGGGVQGGGVRELTAWEERGAMALLVLLYFMQGVPMGLTLGAMPFMLQSRLSYSQLGTFSLAAYPYSLKLLWSPVVDSLYSTRLGRRKTWIVPIQLLTAAGLFFCAPLVGSLYEAARIGPLTAIFFGLVLLAATQDIAVDGWALTLLSPANVGYAATCQTLGTSTGYFTSFTVFLALQDTKFCNTYIRSTALWQDWLHWPAHVDAPLVTLPAYLQFWGLVFALATLAIWLLVPEGSAFSAEELQSRRHLASLAAALRQTRAEDLAEQGRDDTGQCGRQGKQSGGGWQGWLQAMSAEVAPAYWALWGVVRLPAVWGLAALLLTYRLGVLAAEGAFALKLIDKGVAKETLAFLVLFQFPVEIASAVIAGRWAAHYQPYGPFITGYFLRLGVVAACIALTAHFPPGAELLQWGMVGSGWFAALAACSLAGAFVSTLCFTALSSFFNTISDPAMGGAYLTLLNTIANMGVILPKAPAFYLMDVLTRTECTSPVGSDAGSTSFAGLQCPSKPKELLAPSACTAAGGRCVVAADGFYLVSTVSLVLGGVLGAVYLRYLPRLMALPREAWRAMPAAAVEESDARLRAPLQKRLPVQRASRSKARED